MTLIVEQHFRHISADRDNAMRNWTRSIFGAKVLRPFLPHQLRHYGNPRDSIGWLIVRLFQKRTMLDCRRVALIAAVAASRFDIWRNSLMNKCETFSANFSALWTVTWENLSIIAKRLNLCMLIYMHEIYGQTKIGRFGFVLCESEYYGILVRLNIYVYLHARTNTS